MKQAQTAGDVAVPVTAATVILLRPVSEEYELFMVRRHIKSDFASDVYVFPGGKVDASDDDARRALELSDRPHPEVHEPECGWEAVYMAAVRELFEETGIVLARTSLGPLNLSQPAAIDRFARYRKQVRSGRITLSRLADREGISYVGNALRLFSNWVTPPILTKRFDTYFFLAVKPPFQEPRHADLHELTDSLWISPNQALDRYHQDLFPLVYATLRHLEQLAEFKSIDSLLEFTQTNLVHPVHPQPVMRNGRQDFLIPGDRGYTPVASE